jgi:antitoxin component YwqK of YwqJK toxin-antitoxin module
MSQIELIIREDKIEKQKALIDNLYPAEENVKREYLFEEYTDFVGWDDNYYIDNKLVLQKTYWSNGNSYCIFPMVDGKLNGVAQTWSEDGKLLTNKIYKNGCCVSITKNK